jgi:hypothetical protein
VRRRRHGRHKVGRKGSVQARNFNLPLFCFGKATSPTGRAFTLKLVNAIIRSISRLPPDGSALGSVRRTVMDEAAKRRIDVLGAPSPKLGSGANQCRPEHIRNLVPCQVCLNQPLLHNIFTFRTFHAPGVPQGPLIGRLNSDTPSLLSTFKRLA